MYTILLKRAVCNVVYCSPKAEWMITQGILFTRFKRALVFHHPCSLTLTVIQQMGKTALMMASEKNNTAIMAALLADSRVDVNIQDTVKCNDLLTSNMILTL